MREAGRGGSAESTGCCLLTRWPGLGIVVRCHTGGGAGQGWGSAVSAK